MGRFACAVLIALSMAPGALRAQEPSRLVVQADVAAQESRHRDAIELYERAIAEDPSLRSALLAKLGRQYLWAGETRRGVRALREYLEQYEDCGVLLDYALGLSWSNDLGPARDVYERVRQQCPDHAREAALGEARVLRWSNRPSAAAAMYRSVLGSGTREQQVQARIGLGFTMVMNNQPRSAEVLFRELERLHPGDAAVYEGQVLAALQLGLPPRAEAVIGRAASAGVQSAELQRLLREIRSRRRVAVTTGATAFQESDGSTFAAVEAAGSFATSSDVSAQVTLRRSVLARADLQVRGTALGLHLSHRMGQALAMSVRTEAHAMESTGFAPLVGEVNVVWTPSDRQRVDLAVAHLTVLDNLAAVQAELTGSFASLGLDRWLTPRDVISGAMDVTQWSEGNRRIRARASARHHFQGTPQVAAEWSTAYQTYDEGFSFALWSPASYIETGPAVSVDGRVGAQWYWSGYARAGGQRENDLPWRALGTARVSLERAIEEHWGVRAELGWSNSNVAGVAGYERTSFSIQVTHRW